MKLSKGRIIGNIWRAIAHEELRISESTSKYWLFNHYQNAWNGQSNEYGWSLNGQSDFTPHGKALWSEGDTFL